MFIMYVSQGLLLKSPTYGDRVLRITSILVVAIICQESVPPQIGPQLRHRHGYRRIFWHTLAPAFSDLWAYVWIKNNLPGATVSTLIRILYNLCFGGNPQTGTQRSVTFS